MFLVGNVTVICRLEAVFVVDYIQATIRPNAFPPHGLTLLSRW